MGNVILERKIPSDETKNGILSAAKNKRSLPKTGEPNSSQVLLNPDGTPKQKRWYGPDGNAIRDRDYNHSGEEEFPHDHVWEDGKRGEEHLPPDLNYEFSLNSTVGIGIIILSAIGIRNRLNISGLGHGFMMIYGE